MFSQIMGAVLVSSLLAQAASAAESYVFKTKEPQQMAIINTGSLSLQKRLEMIERAKRIMYYLSAPLSNVFDFLL